MSDLKNSWKETGKGLGQAFAGLGKSIVKSAKAGIDKADQWADRDKNHDADPNTVEAEATVVVEKD